jgi:ArsR family metal-binding transcriptional regulator
MLLRSGKIVDSSLPVDTFASTLIKNKKMKFIVRNFKKLLLRALDDKQPVSKRIRNVYNVLDFALNNLFTLCKDVSYRQLLQVLYLKAHDIIIQIYNIGDNVDMRKLNSKDHVIMKKIVEISNILICGLQGMFQSI